MHELSLAEDMLTTLQERAKADGFEQVKTVWLEVGKLSHVDAQAMTFCFDAVMSGTLAEGAKLEIIATSGKGQCRHCHQVSQIEHLYAPCSYCGEFGLEVVQGDQIRIKSVEVF